MRILITTGIYPPKIGGPAQYSKNLKEALIKEGIEVSVATFGIESYLPTGLRHFWFMLKIVPKVLFSDVVISMDTFSVALPSAIVSKLFHKNMYIRTGGDFLWEQYVERTGKKVLFREFYKTEVKNFSKKEKIIFDLTKWTLKNTKKIIFSTAWQRDIFISAYGLDLNNTSIIENYYGPKEGDTLAIKKDFIASTRELVWKNIDFLKKIFDKIKDNHPEAQLVTKNSSFDDFMNQMKESYAVILVSLGDISPNMILDAIRFNRPFICTKEIGIFERIKDAGIFVDPMNEKQIENAVLELLTTEGYTNAKDKIRQFEFLHSWSDIAKEFLIEISKK